jgi:hypothetical protein
MITPLAILFAQYREDHSGASDRDPASSVIALLPFIYVLFAAGVGFDKAPLRNVDDHAYPLCIATHVVFRA